MTLGKLLRPHQPGVFDLEHLVVAQVQGDGGGKCLVSGAELSTELGISVMALLLPSHICSAEPPMLHKCQDQGPAVWASSLDWGSGGAWEDPGFRTANSSLRKPG